MPARRPGVFTSLSAILTAAVDDELISANPCRKASVKAPKLQRRKVTPWPLAGSTMAALGAVMRCAPRLKRRAVGESFGRFR